MVGEKVSIASFPICVAGGPATLSGLRISDPGAVIVDSRLRVVAPGGQGDGVGAATLLPGGRAIKGARIEVVCGHHKGSSAPEVSILLRRVSAAAFSGSLIVDYESGGAKHSLTYPVSVALSPAANQ
ncbi:hypothetical protein VV02_10955 [Luteipulveratus mongoliensis]|uniref:Uncharacterized protein n=1 Tax=Luteipulveratus mongoliensis TaxID=571913 RepID=A0A0K1JHS2_9MICO|nr:hypothetical protein VV02_10955 [Luteipulveratus mongoliensis]